MVIIRGVCIPRIRTRVMSLQQPRFSLLVNWGSCPLDDHPNRKEFRFCHIGFYMLLVYIRKWRGIVGNKIKVWNSDMCMEFSKFFPFALRDAFVRVSVKCLNEFLLPYIDRILLIKLTVSSKKGSDFSLTYL